MRQAIGRRSIAALLALPLAAIVWCGGAFAQSVGDVDVDGIPDDQDNCLDVPNGPLAWTGNCDSQEDADQDGFGNACDGDFNNDGASGLDDCSLLYIAAANVSTDPIFDMNCDGAVGFDDFSILWVGYLVLALPPGPSGLSCAGVGPFPCP